MSKSFECNIDWKDIVLFDFEKVFSVMRGLKLPMIGNPLTSQEEKIPESITELQEHLVGIIDTVLRYIGHVYPSRDRVIKIWRFNSFLFLFDSYGTPQLTIAFAPFVTGTNIVSTMEIE